MALTRALVLALAVVACATPAQAQPTPLAPMAFLQGCWIGAFDGAGELKDERCFTPMHEGRQLRDIHTVVGTGYGGETIYAWDADARQISATYYANDGGLMRGAVLQEGDSVHMPDARYVGADGNVQRLRSRWVRQRDGFVTETEREEGGVWRPLMRIVYVRAE